MPTDLILAPPAAGKTTACIERILAMRREQPLAPIRVVVPDRLQASAFRHRLAAAGGVMGCAVGTFGGLYQFILEQAGEALPVTTTPVQHRLLQDTVDECAASGELPLFAPLRTFPGFIQVLRDAFAELKRSLVFPEDFQKIAAAGSPAHRELARLYERYQARLQTLRWADPEGMSWLAVKAMERRPDIAAAFALLVVDGFDAFTGAQMQALELLSRQAGRLLVTFPGQPGSTRPAHRRFADTAAVLKEKLAPLTFPLEGGPRLPPALRHIEQVLFDPGAQPCAQSARLALIEAHSPSEEAREALRWIKALVVRQDVPLAECAVFTPNPDLYHPLLKAAADEFGMRVRFTRGEPLSRSPAITALTNLLALPLLNFKTRLLFNVLRSPYFDAGIPAEAVDLLEQVSRASLIVEGPEQWQEAWHSLGAAAQGTQPDLEEDLPLPELPPAAQHARLRCLLEALFGLFPQPGQIRSQTAWIAWLEDTLERLDFYRKADTPQEETACEAFRETLRSLVLGEVVAGERQLDYARFCSDLQGTLEGAGVSETTRWNEPALLVANVLEARGLRFQAAALLGLSEGIFPAVERADPFLDEELREKLKLEPRLKREQAGLFYQAVTRADRHLLLTRPYLSDDGEKWEESPYWKAVTRLFDPCPMQTIRPDDPRPLAEAASSQELLFLAVRRGSLPGRFAGLSERWQELRAARDVLRARRGRRASGRFEGYADSLAPLLGGHYPPQLIWSSSRLETYGNCPFRFFIQYALELEPPVKPEVGLNAAQLGSILHNILEEYYRSAAVLPDPRAAQQVLEETARRVFAAAPGEFGFRPSPLWAVEQEQHLQTLRDNVQAMAEKGDGWEPVALEVKFGIGAAPPLEILLEEETIRIRGMIDRVDRNNQGELRVIDYKTGGSHMAAADLERGYRLQLPVYALAARDALGLGEPVEGFYWLINAAKASSIQLAKFGVEEGISLALEHIERIVRGVRAGAFPPQPPRGGCPSYCAGADWCWRYEPGW